MSLWTYKQCQQSLFCYHYNYFKLFCQNLWMASIYYEILGAKAHKTEGFQDRTLPQFYFHTTAFILDAYFLSRPFKQIPMRFKKNPTIPQKKLNSMQSSTLSILLNIEINKCIIWVLSVVLRKHGILPTNPVNMMQFLMEISIKQLLF